MINRPPSIKLLAVESGISALGFRKIIGIARVLNPESDVYFLPVDNLYSFTSHLFSSRKSDFDDKDIDTIVNEFSNANLVCFSSMSPAAEYVEKLARKIKDKNPNVFLLWGGAHCTLCPEEAIKHVDAICIGEGEKTFKRFYEAFKTNGDFTSTPGMWFRTNERIIRNRTGDLCDTGELNVLPHPFMGGDCKIYHHGSGKFRAFRYSDYTRFNGLAYRTVWTRGCPFDCSFCANDAFIELDKGYQRIRFPSVKYIISEIENALGYYPFISTVGFYDDNFIAVPIEIIREFAHEYTRKIGLPFAVFGLSPQFITEEKIEVLANAGMNRMRMGIQSGNSKSLELFNRKTSTEVIRSTVSVLAKAARKFKMIPPAYDIISDNPVESRQDVINTLEFIYTLERPFFLTVFSLRVFPKTRLWEYFKNNPEIDIRQKDSSYLDTEKNMANILLHILSICKPPEMFFKYLLGFVNEKKKQNIIMTAFYYLSKSMYLSNRALRHIQKFDFTAIVGDWLYLAWKMKLIPAHGNRAQKNV